MKTVPRHRSGTIRPASLSRSGFAALVIAALMAGRAGAQAPPPPPNPPLSGFPSTLPMVPIDTEAPKPLAPFIKSLGTSDAMFEVKVGQGRLLTFQEDLAVPGQARPVIATGDPGVIDFVIVGPRQLRII